MTRNVPTMTVQKFMPRTTERMAETNLQLLLFHIIYIYYRDRRPGLCVQPAVCLSLYSDIHNSVYIFLSHCLTRQLSTHRTTTNEAPKQSPQHSVRMDVVDMQHQRAYMSSLLFFFGQSNR